MLPRSLLELPRDRPLDVSCSDGTLWLTIDDDPRDFVLEPGERVRLEAGRRVLAYAMGASVMEIRAVREQAAPAASRPLLSPRFAVA